MLSSDYAGPHGILPRLRRARDGVSNQQLELLSSHGPLPGNKRERGGGGDTSIYKERRFTAPCLPLLLGVSALTHSSGSEEKGKGRDDALLPPSVRGHFCFYFIYFIMLRFGLFFFFCCCFEHSLPLSPTHKIPLPRLIFFYYYYFFR